MADAKRSYDSDEYFEDDPRQMIAIHNAEEKLHLSPRGVGLDLSLAAAERKASGGGRSDERDNVQEANVLVIFDLPDGSQGESYFRMGQTVEFLKSFIESEYGIPMRAQKLMLDGKLMMDPLSLLDFPEAKGLSEIIVQVSGPMPDSAKK